MSHHANSYGTGCSLGFLVRYKQEQRVVTGEKHMVVPYGLFGTAGIATQGQVSALVRMRMLQRGQSRLQ